jgi:F1F0 ATPase subunit 2
MNSSVTMGEFMLLALPFTAGLLLGALFFGGLWWTVIKGVSSRRPALWFFGSLMLRLSITLAGFYFVARENWQRWLLCLLGFVLARLVVKWLTRAPVEHRSSATPQSRCAP